MVDGEVYYYDDNNEVDGDEMRGMGRRENYLQEF